MAGAACGGGPAGRSGGEGRGGDPAGAARQHAVILYRDGARVSERRRVALRAGENELRLAGVARGVLPGSAELRSLSDPRGTRALSWRLQPARGAIAPAGSPIAVERPGEAVRGKLRTADGSRLVVETGEEGELVALARPAAITAEVGEERDGALLWRVLARSAGEQEIEQSYDLAGVTWAAAYTLIVARGEEQAAWLQGWLSVANHSGADLAPARAWVVDAPLRPAAPPLSIVTPREGEQMPPPPPAPHRPGPVELAVPVAVPSGAIRQVDLFPGGRVRLPVTFLRVYDPVGPALDNPRRQPRIEPEYGAARGRDVHVYAEADLGGAGLPDLPAGEMTAFERSTGGLTPLGSAAVFERRSERDEGAARRERRLRLPVGLAPGLTGSRRQAEFTLDPHRRRLLEEIRITLDNRGDSEAEVLVREHLYRGRNWALVYFNDAGPLRKTGPQEIEVRVRVPPGKVVLAAYRVVYTW